MEHKSVQQYHKLHHPKRLWSWISNSLKQFHHKLNIITVKKVKFFAGLLDYKLKIMFWFQILSKNHPLKLSTWCYLYECEVFVFHVILQAINLIYCNLCHLQVCICGYPIATGAASRLISGYDSYGNTCGHNNTKIEGVPLSGRDMKENKLVWFVTNDLRCDVFLFTSNASFSIIECYSKCLLSFRCFHLLCFPDLVMEWVHSSRHAETSFALCSQVLVA